MKKLKIVLQHNYIYLFLIFIISILYLINNTNHISIYNDFNNKTFKVTNITKYDYGIKLDLKSKEKIIGYLYNTDTTYNLGDKVIIFGIRKDINTKTVPYTFDYKKYLNNKKIYNVVEIKSIKKIKNNKNIFYSLKNTFTKRSYKLKKSYPYINSLLFGNNSYIEKEVLETYKQNGIMHLFAISGLHISLFILLISKIFNKHKNKAICLFLIFFMFLTNFSISVLRSSVFAMLKILNKKLEFNLSNNRLLLLTLILVLFINPLSIESTGLHYSFLISFFIINFKTKKKISTSMLIFLVSYPITINNYYEINILSIIYNLLYIPYVSFILLPSILIAYIFPFLDNILYIFIKIIEYSSSLLNNINIFKISFCKLSIIFVLIYYYLLYKNLKDKNKKHKIMLLIFFIVHFLSPLKNNNYIMFLDVGQGDSSVIKIKNNVTMIDTGGLYNEGSVAKNKLIPYLKGSGIKKIDTLILTHGDNDHVGDAKYLVENFKVKKVIFNCGEYNDLENEIIKTLDKKKIKYYSCIKELNIKNNKLYFLNTKLYDDENDNSVVIYTKINNKKFLFMGDASITTEKEILDKYNLTNIDVLKVGHHGSKTSSSIEFINEINPKYSIISVGKNNRYGHPNKEVLDNLEDSKIYRTDIDGSILCKIKKK